MARPVQLSMAGDTRGDSNKGGWGLSHFRSAEPRPPQLQIFLPADVWDGKQPTGRCHPGRLTQGPPRSGSGSRDSIIGDRRLGSVTRGVAGGEGPMPNRRALKRGGLVRFCNMGGEQNPGFSLNPGTATGCMWRVGSSMTPMSATGSRSRPPRSTSGSSYSSLLGMRPRPKLRLRPRQRCSQCVAQNPERDSPWGLSRSFSKARFRICRMRSRVTPRSEPISSRVRSSPSSSP